MSKPEDEEKCPRCKGHGGDPINVVHHPYTGCPEQPACELCEGTGLGPEAFERHVWDRWDRFDLRFP